MNKNKFIIKTKGVLKLIKRKIIRPTALERLRYRPDYFKTYRYLNSHPEMKRFAGGWEYKQHKYSDYLFMGGAGCAIFYKAKQLIHGMGLDIGAGYWEFPGSIPIDPCRGDGRKNTLDKFEQGSLDYIFSSHYLEHTEEWKAEIKNWIGLLKTGGRLFLYLPHPDCMIWRPGAPGIGDGHKWIPDLQTIEKYLLSLGMRTISKEDGPDGMMSFYICTEK